ncbi:hypothetical protein COCNU_12G005610 [Cocos nucifera]|uniref:Inositol polyphosphate-related phosphatase domain-containing protein n=1 Tax=Cocos nucifera TaxID=13894 RepID=A0A8K0IS36_COCNU|nr:hypothetical protein COCNU_12G005610 [Cocos nucifera]
MLYSSKTPDLTASSGDPRPATCVLHVARVPAAAPRRSPASMPRGQDHSCPLLCYLDHPVVVSEMPRLHDGIEFALTMYRQALHHFIQTVCSLTFTGSSFEEWLGWEFVDSESAPARGSTGVEQMTFRDDRRKKSFFPRYFGMRGKKASKRKELSLNSSEDNEPAAKWLALINQALNRPTMDADTPSPYANSSSQASSLNASLSRDLRNGGDSLFFQKQPLKSGSKIFNVVQGRHLKQCNCPSQVAGTYYKDSCFSCPQAYISDDDSSDEEEEVTSSFSGAVAASAVSDKDNQRRYSLIASKQMVGIFVTVWVRRELVQHIGHLRLSCVGRGIMRYLGNKGCISVSMSLHQTTFCFVCSHLASGDKEGDEFRRNSDVTEILKNTNFQRICRSPCRRIPQKILEHDRVIWLGDLNYRIALSYSETRKLLEDNNWDALLEKDQNLIEFIDTFLQYLQNPIYYNFFDLVFF